MYYGMVALLTRALRQDARQRRNHVFRVAFAGFIYLAMSWASLQAAFFGAPGLLFFQQIVALNVLFITCAGIGYFSSAITEEKEEETLGLLQMAGLNHIGILLGKSTSRLVQVMFLLVVQFPFMLLAVTLGGVTTHQLVAAYVDLLAFTILLANLAVVCSVIFQRGGNAAAITTLLMALYAVLPFVATRLRTEMQMAGWTNTSNGTTWILTSLDWVEQSCVFYELAKVMQTGFNEPIITKQVISNIAFGGICFVLAWLMFGPAINHTVAGGVTRGTVLKSTSRVKFLSPGRVWSNPLVWKDFQFIGGGYSLFVVKLVLYLVLLATLTVVSQYPGNWLNLSWDDLGSAYFVTMLVILLVEACILASRIFHDEVRLQTLSSLLMLPRSIPYLAYSKAIGCLLGLLPAGICLIVSLFLLPETHLLAIWNALIEPGLWGAVGGVLIFLHLVALLSLFVRWGALPLAVFLMGPILMCCPFPQLVFLVGSAGMQDFWAKIPATITVWILNGMVCFVFQMMIGSRLEELGTK